MAGALGARLAPRPTRAGGIPLIVGVLTTSYPRFPGDYAGCFVEDNVRALRAAGHQVEVFAATESPLFYGEGAPEVLERGGLAPWLQALHFWGGLCQALRYRAPYLDALVTHWLVPCAAAALAVAPELPLRAYAHSGDVALLERLPGGDALARWIASRASGADLVFVTAALRRRFAALVGREVGRVEPLTVPAALFHPAQPSTRQEARARLGFTGPTVVSVGRLVPIKGFDLLLAACAQIAADGAPAPQLVIIGDGPQRVALEARARRLGVRLSLPGFVPRSQLATWLAAADVYAQPSRRLASGRTEGLPVSALEALAVGLPVVAPDAGGFPELAARCAGMTLVPSGDARALGQALRLCLQAGIQDL